MSIPSGSCFYGHAEWKKACLWACASQWKPASTCVSQLTHGCGGSRWSCLWWRPGRAGTYCGGDAASSASHRNLRSRLMEGEREVTEGWEFNIYLEWKLETWGEERWLKKDALRKRLQERKQIQQKSKSTLLNFSALIHLICTLCYWWSDEMCCMCLHLSNTTNNRPSNCTTRRCTHTGTAPAVTKATESCSLACCTVARRCLQDWTESINPTSYTLLDEQVKLITVECLPERCRWRAWGNTGAFCAAVSGERQEGNASKPSAAWTGSSVSRRQSICPAGVSSCVRSCPQFYWKS